MARATSMMGWSMLQNPALYLFQQRKGLRRLPRSVAHLTTSGHQRRQQRRKMSNGLVRSMKRERELQQHPVFQRRAKRRIQRERRVRLRLLSRG